MNYRSSVHPKNCLEIDALIPALYLKGVMMKPMKEKETTDEIIQETRRIKEALAKSMDFDLDRIDPLEDARQKQEKSGRVVLSPPVQPIL